MTNLTILPPKLERGITSVITRLDGFLKPKEILEITNHEGGIDIVFGEHGNYSTSIDTPCTGLPRIIQRERGGKAAVITPLGKEVIVYLSDIDSELSGNYLLTSILKQATQLRESLKEQINQDNNREVIIFTDDSIQKPPALIIRKSNNGSSVGIDIVNNIPYFVFYLDGFEYRIRTSRRDKKTNFGNIITPELVKTNYFEFLEMLFLLQYIQENYQ